MIIKAKDQWFAIFGTDGAPFVKGIINSILGVILVMVLVTFALRLASLIIKGKTIEEEDERINNKKAIRKAIIGFIISAISSALMILTVNIIPRPSGSISNSSWFDSFGDTEGEVKKIVNWIMAVITAVGIVVFLITTPIKIWKWAFSDDEDKGKKMKSIIVNVISIVALLTLTLTVTIIANVIPNPSAI